MMTLLILQIQDRQKREYNHSDRIEAGIGSIDQFHKVHKDEHCSIYGKGVAKTSPTLSDLFLRFQFTDAGSNVANAPTVAGHRRHPTCLAPEANNSDQFQRMHSFGKTDKATTWGQ